jgi:REP element-mobilizing transposase RayT
VKDKQGRSHRRSLRLAGYDYSQPGAYFITLVTKEREYIFGKFIDGLIELSQSGKIVQRVWYELPHHYEYITLDWFVIMPNHFHGIIFINDTKSGTSISPKGRKLEDNPILMKSSDISQIPPIHPHIYKQTGLPEIVRALKSYSARRINNLMGTTGRPVWQRNYYEHIIRNQIDLDAIREYIDDNPRRWMEDSEYRV